MSRRVIGIDLGTTSSAVAISDGISPRLIPDSFGRTILPSLVVIRKDRQFFVGHEAVVEARKYSGENLTIGSLKRMMDRQKEFHHGQIRTSPQVLTAMIIAELKVQAEMYLGEEVTQAVIAVPANFGFPRSTRKTGCNQSMDAVADFTRWGSQPCRSRSWDFVSLVCFVVSTAFVRFIQDFPAARFAGCSRAHLEIASDSGRAKLLCLDRSAGKRSVISDFFWQLRA